MAALLGRASTVHTPHAGMDIMLPDSPSCRLPLPAAFLNASSPRVVFHDLLRTGVETLLAGAPQDVARMQRLHGWDATTLSSCRTRRGSRGTYFMQGHELLAFYKDEDCAKVYMPSAVGRGLVCDHLRDASSWSGACF